MRYKYIFMTLFLAVSNMLSAQFLHTPEELEEIVSKKPAKYQLQETENLSQDAFKNCRASANKLEANLSSSPNPILTASNLSKSQLKKLKKKNKKILKRAKSDNLDIDLIEELSINYFKLGQFKEALHYRKLLPNQETRSVSEEYFLATSYLKTKKYNLALEHAFNAKVLLPYQRKNADPKEQKVIELLLKQILAGKKKMYLDWTLHFSYCIANRDGKTYISFKTEPWKHYAICKSVWQEDPEHKSKMATVSDQAPWLVEEKECLLNTLVAYQRHESMNPAFKGLDHLALALDENTVKEFIIYEKFIAQYQAIPNGIPSKSEIEKLRAYFLKAHSSSKN